eukprot:TRINITY_DN15302_c0_g1_i1.p1 TRINITY_DN15302_c0_g1~~TRINITY_DN15302_c0_g1_i1.p1  ORF type:complete len:241 (-),score=17.81 TRINITY_DN15302_c0_g1_i1:61-783(-)
MLKGHKYKQEYDRRLIKVADLSSSKKIQVEVTDTLSITTKFGMKFRKGSTSENIIEDLHNALSDFAFMIRGLSGLINPTQSFTFLQVETAKRKSRYKFQTDVISVYKNLRQGQDPFPSKVGSLKETEVFDRFRSDIATLVRQRGLDLNFLNISNRTLMKDGRPSFWLSLESVSQDDKRIESWHKNFSEFHKMYSQLSFYPALLPKSFKTRQNQGKKNLLTKSLTQNEENKRPDLYLGNAK